MVSLVTHSASAQLKATVLCPPFTVDLLDGNVNKQIYPKSTLGEIEKMFPCFTDKVEGDSAHCSRLFYVKNGISFFPERTYIEIHENFKGTLKPALMGAARSSLFSMLGYPKIKDLSWDAFQTEYGTLVLYYNKAGRINKIQFSSRRTEAMKLCE